MMENNKAAVYARVSTEEQVKEGFSIQAQLEELRHYAKLHDLDIIEEYVEEGASGKSIAGRPRMQKLLKDANRGLFQTVLVFKLDRLARKLKDALEISEHLDGQSIKLISLKESFDTNTPIGKMLFQLMGSFAELERSTIVDRVKMGLTERAKQGKFTGGLCLGYDSVNKSLIINTSEAHVVREIYDLAEQGLGYKAIVNRINSSGYTSKKDKSFSVNGIKKILKNPMYIGKIRYNQLENWSEKRRHGKNPNYLLVDGEHEPIISEEQWEKVQAIMHKRSYKPSRCGEPYILSGLLKCPRCGTSMVPGRSRSSSGKSYRYYVCGQHHNKGQSVCSAHSIRADLAETEVMQRLSQIVSNPITLKTLVDKINEERSNAEQPLIAEKTHITARLNTLERRVGNIVNELVDDPALKNILAPKLKEMELEKSELADKLASLDTQLSACDTTPVDLESIRILLSDFRTTISAVDPEQQKALLRLVIKEITVTEEAPRAIDKIKLYFDFTLESILGRSVELITKMYSRQRTSWKIDRHEIEDLFESSNILPLLMIRFTPVNLKRPINLLRQNQPHQLVRVCQLPKGQPQVSPLYHTFVQAQRPPDHKSDLAFSRQTPGGYGLGQLTRVQHLPFNGQHNYNLPWFYVSENAFCFCGLNLILLF